MKKLYKNFSFSIDTTSEKDLENLKQEEEKLRILFLILYDKQIFLIDNMRIFDIVSDIREGLNVNSNYIKSYINKENLLPCTITGDVSFKITTNDTILLLNNFICKNKDKFFNDDYIFEGEDEKLNKKNLHFNNYTNVVIEM